MQTFARLASSSLRRPVVSTGRRNMSMHKALADMGETNAIVLCVVSAAATAGVITAITRMQGSKQTLNGFTSISDGQPYTTDPVYVSANVAYRKFQNMDPITEFKKSGRV